MSYRHPARGNVLLIVLVAIALFAALNFVLVKSWGGISGKTTGEQSRLSASELIQYGNGLRTVTDKMMLMGSVSDINTSGNGILLAATGAHAAYGVVGAQPTTELFHPSGGAAAYQTPPPAACLSTCVYEFTGQYTITGVAAAAVSELAMLVIDVPPDVCQKANDVLGHGWAAVPTGGALTLTRFNGTNYGSSGGANPITLTGGANEFVGKRAFCYRESAGAERYIYLHVIRAR